MKRVKSFQNKQTGVLSSSDLKTGWGQFVYWLFFGILIICCVLSLLPAIWAVLTAFKETEEIYSSFTFFPKAEDFIPANMWAKITTAWNELNILRPIVNTVFMSVVQLAFTLVVTGFGGYVLSKLKPRGSALIFVLVIWTMMMPSQIRMVPAYVANLHFPFAYPIQNPLGKGVLGISLLGTYWPMWISAAANTFNVVLFKNSFDALSQSYVEAGKLDGCGNFGIFFRIMLPLSLPSIIYVSIITLSGAWADFFSGVLYLQSKPDLVTVPYKVYLVQNSSGDNIQMNTIFMCFIFASIPPFIIFACFQKHIMGGVNIGGVKG